MSTIVTSAMCAAALMALVAGLASPAAAQDRYWGGPLLVGPGSTIGIAVAEVTSDDPAVRQGVLVQQVQPGSPAARAGFLVGDIVVEFDGERVRGTRQFVRVVQETPPNREVTAIVMREGARRGLTVTPELGRADVSSPRSGMIFPGPDPFFSRPPPGRELPGDVESAPGLRLGTAVTTLDEQLAQYFGVDGGLLVTSVEAGSPAAQAGVRAGDVMTRLGNRQVRAPADVTDALSAAKAGATLELEVVRDKKRMRLQVRLPELERQPRETERFRL